VLIGTGAVAEEVVEIFGSECFVGCFTDPAYADQVRVDLPVLTDLDRLARVATHFVLAFSGHAARARLRTRLLALGLQRAAPLVSPHAQVSPSAHLSPGAMIGHFVCVGPRTQVGSDTLVMHTASIAHDSVVGADVFCGQGSKISGHARVGERSVLGANAVVGRGVSIGADVELASGAICFRDVADRYRAIGNPARLIAPSIDGSHGLDP
jgi:acetyltransferase EpsM